MRSICLRAVRPLYLRGIQSTAFICGCGHTGTTLMTVILATHPQLHVPLYETNAFVTPGRRYGRILALRRLRRDALAAGTSYIVEKTPRHIRRLALIRRWVPGARFVVMVRDGRDVTASIGKRDRGDFAGGLERWVSDTAIAVAERDKSDVFVQRYEDLVSDPAAAIREVCRFLEIPYLDSLLEYHREQRSWAGETIVRKGTGVGPSEHRSLRNWQINQPIFDGRGRWTRELPPEIVSRFDSGRPRELMETFGYAAS